MMDAFADDWGFTTGEQLAGQLWFPALEAAGGASLRTIPSGPDSRVETLETVLLGALNSATDTIWIVTPYFLPTRALIAALRVASLRGLAVDIVLPERINLPFVRLAAAAALDELLEAGCRIWLSRPPFDHSKLMRVDGIWSLFGSMNWDSRSLRLNFEFNVEGYDRALAATLQDLVDGKIETARPLERAELAGRAVAVKLRDAFARLFAPYL